MTKPGTIGWRTGALPVIAALASLPMLGSSATVRITALVAQSCSVGSDHIAFGLPNPAQAPNAGSLPAVGAVTIACTRDAMGATIGIDDGDNFAGGRRNLKGAKYGRIVPYALFKDAAHTTPWDDAANRYTVESPSSTGPNTLSIYGATMSEPDLQSDTYTDTVIATINY